jgi:hypothetical protein
MSAATLSWVSGSGRDVLAPDFVPPKTFGRRIVKREAGRDVSGGRSRSFDAQVPDLRRRIGDVGVQSPMRLSSAIGAGVAVGLVVALGGDAIEFAIDLWRSVAGLL